VDNTIQELLKERGELCHRLEKLSAETRLLIQKILENKKKLSLNKECLFAFDVTDLEFEVSDWLSVFRDTQSELNLET